MVGKTLYTLFAQGLGTLGSIFIGIVLARVLGPSGRGVTSYALLVLGLVAIYADGPAAAVMTQYASDKIRRADVYRGLLRALPVLVVPATIAFALVAIYVPGQRALLAVACALPFAVYGQCVKGLFLAESRIKTANMVDLLPVAGYAVLGSAVVLLGGGIAGALAAWVVANIASALFAGASIGRAPALERASGEGAAAPLARDQLLFGGKSGLMYAAGYVNLRMGAFVVAAMLGSAALGIYTVVVGISELLWKISNALAWSAFGRIAGDDDVRDLVGRITRSVVLVELALGAAVFAVGPWLITRVYGAAFASAALPLRIMVFGVAAYALEPILGYFILVRCKRPMLILGIQVVAAAVCAGIALLAIPRYGIAGAAAATALTYVIVVAVKAVIVARTLGISVTELIVPRMSDVRSVAGSLTRAARRRLTPLIA